MDGPLVVFKNRAEMNTVCGFSRFEKSCTRFHLLLFFVVCVSTKNMSFELRTLSFVSTSDKSEIKREATLGEHIARNKSRRLRWFHFTKQSAELNFENFTSSKNQWSVAILLASLSLRWLICFFHKHSSTRENDPTSFVADKCSSTVRSRSLWLFCC